MLPLALSSGKIILECDAADDYRLTLGKTSLVQGRQFIYIMPNLFNF
jgi:hypothetical protein